jgi:hypothetical protein
MIKLITCKGDVGDGRQGRGVKAVGDFLPCQDLNSQSKSAGMSLRGRSTALELFDFLKFIYEHV